MNVKAEILGIGAAVHDRAPHQVQNQGLFRLFLAALVVVQHYQKLIFGEPSGLLIEALEVGSLAVLVFFMLSGYVIIGAVDRFYRARPLAFIFNRINRIVPLFFAVVLLSVLTLAPLAQSGLLLDDGGQPVSMAAFSPANLLANLLAIVPMGHVLATPSYEFVSIVWAVQTEMTFYLVVFAALVAAMLLRIGFAPIAFAVASVFLGLAALRIGSGTFGMATLALAPHFVLGGALYYWRKSQSPAALLLGLASAALVLFELLARPATHEALGFVRAQGGQLAVLVALTAILIAGTYRSFVPKALDRLAGEYSYPVYLCHILPAIFAASLGAAAQPSLAWLVAALAGTVIFSTAMLHLVDGPMASLRNRVRRLSIV